MNSRIENCQNCDLEFSIETEDFDFYKRIKIPLPTFCPDCRLKRRLLYRQDRTLYKDVCKMCGKEVVSIYYPNSGYLIYCSSCWWSDKWDPMSYGMEYDFSQPFLKQFNKLMIAVPRQATFMIKSVDCDYCDGATSSKNCYLSFGSYLSEDCLYCNVPIMSRSCVDSDLGVNMSRTYEVYSSNNAHKSLFLWHSDDCLDSAFLFNCNGCSDCFGCINLRKKKYHIFNQPYSKEGYRERMRYWDLGSCERLKEAKKKFEEFYYSMPRRFAMITNSSDVTGDHIKNTKNCKICFNTINGVEDCKYAFINGLNAKDSYDITFSGETSELLYETVGQIRASRNAFMNRGADIRDSMYCENCRNGSNLFGCVGLRNKSYCILNKQYKEEEYHKLKEKIIEHMSSFPYVDKRKKIYRYGEFFPDEFSSWAYNESMCFQWFPLSKKEALDQGYRWQEEKQREYKSSIQTNDLPDHIKDVPDSITNEVIECAHKGECNHSCATAYRIIPRELDFYRSINIALPRLCYNCRFWERIKWRTPPKLWNRKCMCSFQEVANDYKKKFQNTSKHFHGSGPCSNTFNTAIAPHRKEVVYCEDCYRNEFV